MPEAILVASQYVGMTAFQAASASGLSIQVSAAIGGATQLATAGLLYVGLGLALTPQTPSPAAAAQVRKQTQPPRVRGFGIARLGGAWAGDDR